MKKEGKIVKKEDKIGEGEMLPAYDFSSGVKNRYAHGSNIVMIRPEFTAFSSKQAVNDALALLPDAGLRAASRSRLPSGKSKQAKAG